MDDHKQISHVFIVKIVSKNVTSNSEVLVPEIKQFWCNGQQWQEKKSNRLASENNM